MAKFSIELQVKGAIELCLYGIDEDTYNELEDEECFEDGAWEDTAQHAASAIVVSYDDITESDNFSLVVKDEDGNVVYETDDAFKIPMFYYDGEMSFDYHGYQEDEDGNSLGRDLPNFEFTGLPEGFYLVENINHKWMSLEGDFEADEFDPSKLAFYPSEKLDQELCEDEVFISCIRYDGTPIELGDEDGENYGCEYKLLTKGRYWSDDHR